MTRGQGSDFRFRYNRLEVAARTSTPRREVDFLSRLLDVNKATNRLYYRFTQRPHHLAVYKAHASRAVSAGRSVVHLGAGDVVLGDLLGLDLGAHTVYAVDPDLQVLMRSSASTRILARGEALPLQSGSVDAVVCEYVVEHLEHPREVLRELNRILRPGGQFVFLTPNAWSYSAIATRLTSQRFHVAFLGALRRAGASANEKPFPTKFRMNTRRTIEALARETGFKVCTLDSAVDHPTYTYLFPGIHQLATAWHLCLDKLDMLESLRIGWIGVFEKETPAKPTQTC